MPTVAIRGMKMPVCCNECKLMIDFQVVYDETYGCALTRQYPHDMTQRPANCPLVEIVDDEDDLK